MGKRFDDVIKAGQWAISQGYNPEEYKVVNFLPDGSINHRAIIQVYDYKTGKYVLENHYTTCGKIHLPIEKFKEDKKAIMERFSRERYKVNAWIEY